MFLKMKDRDGASVWINLDHILIVAVGQADRDDHRTYQVEVVAVDGHSYVLGGNLDKTQVAREVKKIIGDDVHDSDIDQMLKT